MEPQVSTVDDLDNFIDFLYEGLEGYVYVAAMPAGKPSEWKSKFLLYPTEVDRIKSAIRDTTKAGEVFIGPALYKTAEGGSDRGNFKCSNVAWADFDGNAPQWDSLISHPSMVVQSSEENHQHLYWKLHEPIYDVDALENITRRIQINYQADASCWPAVHVFRPPATFNHKRGGASVKLVFSDSISYDADVFNGLPSIEPEEVPQFVLGEVPDLETVIFQYKIPPDLQLLLKAERANVKDRSASLMNAAFICCEIGMTDVEVFVILKYLDNEWEKFSNRKDQDKQLSRIVIKARTKYPDLDVPTADVERGDNPLLIYRYMDFLNTEINIGWVVEGMLMDGGNMLMAGRSGIGKTQLSLQYMKHIALGKPFLGHDIPKAKKVGFLSLEMGHPDLQVFMHAQDKDFNEDERHLLQQNLDIVPWGEAFPLNMPLWQEQLKVLIEQREWEGIFIDSIGSAILGNISSTEAVQPFTNFNDHIRKKYGVFLWYIHHTRKSAPGQGGPKDQDDVYGDQYLVNRCTSAYGVLDGKAGSIKIRNFKNRLAKKEDDYWIDRTDNINFIRIDQPVEVDGKIKIGGKDDDKPESTAGNFNL